MPRTPVPAAPALGPRRLQRRATRRAWQQADRSAVCVAPGGRKQTGGGGTDAVRLRRLGRDGKDASAAFGAGGRAPRCACFGRARLDADCPVPRRRLPTRG
jgi:hypothetical protein